jgi:UDP-N-acetylglucosamine 2-epimerase
MEAAALGKPVLLIQDMDIPDMEAAANRNVVKAGSGRIEIVARISSLLNGSRAYEAMRQASSERAPSDSYRPMLEALANLRSAPMAPADPLPDMSQDMDPPADARMQGVREAL